MGGKQLVDAAARVFVIAAVLVEPGLGHRHIDLAQTAALAKFAVQFPGLVADQGKAAQRAGLKVVVGLVDPERQLTLQ